MESSGYNFTLNKNKSCESRLITEILGNKIKEGRDCTVRILIIYYEWRRKKNQKNYEDYLKIERMSTGQSHLVPEGKKN